MRIPISLGPDSTQKLNTASVFSAKNFFLACSIAFFTTLLLLACSGNGQTGATGDNAPAGVAISASGGATYSATIDGKPFSGTTTNGATKISLEENSTIDGLNFSLGYQGNKQGFEFVVNNSGNTELRKQQIKTVCNYRTADGVLYIVDSAAVTINPGTGTRTSGTFSGRWKNAHYGKTPADAPESIQVTDGKFDLP
jgi:hypothetical protein